MPLFEEKLISPFAIRFTQEHIRTTFRDGRPLEQTISEIEQRPDEEDADQILLAPFPHIEVVRWKSAEGDYWFTFDNRRLYCLQRVAAACWPLRVRCVVEVLYSADRSSWWRKYDTSVVGQSVSLRPSSVQPVTGTWDWRAAVDTIPTTATVQYLFAVCRAKHAISADEAKGSIDELANVPQMSSLYASSGAPPAPSRADKSSTASTVSDVSDNESVGDGEERAVLAAEEPASDAARTEEELILDSVKSMMTGSWVGDKGELYVLESSGELCWNCRRAGVVGNKKFSMWYDKDSKLIWWGTNWKYFLDPADTREGNGQIVWYAGHDLKKARPKFRWYPSEQENLPPAKSSWKRAKDRWGAQEGASRWGGPQWRCKGQW